MEKVGMAMGKIVDKAAEEAVENVSGAKLEDIGSAVSAAIPPMSNFLGPVLHNLHPYLNESKEDVLALIQKLDDLSQNVAQGAFDENAAQGLLEKGTCVVGNANQRCCKAWEGLTQIANGFDNICASILNFRPSSIFQGFESTPITQAPLPNNSFQKKVLEQIADLKEQAKATQAALKAVENRKNDIATGVAIVLAALSLFFTMYQTYKTYQIVCKLHHDRGGFQEKLNEWKGKFEKEMKEFETLEEISSLLKRASQQPQEEYQEILRELRDEYNSRTISFSRLHVELKEIEGLVKENRGIALGRRDLHNNGWWGSFMSTLTTLGAMMLMPGTPPLMIAAAAAHTLSFSVSWAGYRWCDQEVGDYNKLLASIDEQAKRLQEVIWVCESIMEVLQKGPEKQRSRQLVQNLRSQERESKTS